MPQVTVLMPVMNASRWVGQAIESVLQQSYTDFELLIVDDGSTDDTIRVIRDYRDPRIRLEVREHHFIRNLNEGLRLARGEYIARMDADDIMHSERLRVQVRRMEEMPEVAVCATWMKQFGDNVPSRILPSLRGIVAEPLKALAENNVFGHPTVMMRRAFLEHHRLEYKEYPRAEDYKLWMDIACCGGVFYVEPQPLLFYRISPQQVSRQGQTAGEQVRTEIREYLKTFSIVCSSSADRAEARPESLR